MKEIFINTNGNNKTIVVTQDSKLIEKYNETSETSMLEGNIYLGIITNVLPGMQAAFVDIGDDRNAFLHIRDILPKASNETGNKNEDFSNYNIHEYVRVGMPIVVEVKKDKTGKKGAKVSGNLNIAGRFSVIIPNSNFITISQKIEDINKTERLKEIVKELNIENYGIILRTSSEKATAEQIQSDIINTIKMYENILKIAKEYIESTSVEKIELNNVSSNIFKNSKNSSTHSIAQSYKLLKPTLLLSKGGVIDRLLLDIGNNDLEKVTVNTKSDYNKVLTLINQYNLNVKLELIEKINILNIYNLERQIEKVSNRKVWLKCGGFITIDKTEALTAIDVNSGKFTGKENIEKTVLKVNSEATCEIARQIRARDIGGIIVIDYIDMDNKEDEEIIKKLLTDELKQDRAKTQVIGFTQLHLLEMTRKHICSM